MRCCVPFCRTTAEIVSESEGITFHEFPREVHLRAAWLRALGKQDALLPAGAVVCSHHFLDDEIHETESGSRQIRTGAVPATVLICLICLESRNKLLLISENKLEQAYQYLVGHPAFGGSRLKRTLCVQCAQRVVDFTTFRDESLRARCLVTELLHTHEVITRRHVALLSRYKHPLPSDIEPDRCDVDTARDATATVAAATATDATDVAVAVKREHADTVSWAYNERDCCKALEDTPAAAEADAEPQTPMKREHTCEPESSEDSYQALVAPVVLTTNPGNEEHPTDSSDEWDLFSFENEANVLEDPKKSQDTALKPKETLATISDSIDYRTSRRNCRFKNEQSKHSPGIFSTQLDIFSFENKANVLEDPRKTQDTALKPKESSTRRNDRFINEQSKHSPGIFGTQLGNHTDRMQYICDICQKIFQRKASLVSHIKVHSFAKTLSCELRECKLNQNPMLWSPKTVHAFACELCKYKCTFKSGFVRHMRTHTGEKPFSCKLCKYKCSENSSLMKHTRTHTGEKPFACKLCKYKSTENGNLVKHMRTHTGEKPFACELCKYKCTARCDLVKHMRTHTGEKPFACALCKYKCTVKRNLVSHMRTHTGETPFACALCKYKCTVKKNLVSHMRNHTGEKPFACELCKYKCKAKSNLVDHMRTHTGEKPFSCKLCKYKCSVNGSLVKHMRTHTGEKPFACKLCNFKCAQKSSLVSHMRTHTGEKPFACKLCNYKCAQKSSLVSHMRTHTGEKPFACKLCKYKCTVKSDLVKHMRTHTGEKPFACALCKYKGTVKGSLVKHMKTHTFAC